MKNYDSSQAAMLDLIKNTKLAERIVLPMLTKEFMKDVLKYIPKNKGTLRSMQKLYSLPKKGLVIVKAPQARRLYYAPESWNWTTSGTGPHWNEKNEIENRKKYKLMAKKLHATILKGR